MADQNILFEYSQNILKIFLVWCFHKKCNTTLFDKTLNSLPVIFLYSLIGVLSSLDVIEAIQMDEIDAKFTKLLFFCVSSVVTQKVIIITYTERKTRQCIYRLQNLSSLFENKSHFENAHGLYRKIFLIALFAINISVFFFMIAPVLFLQSRKLFFEPNMGFINMQETPIWELMFILQSTSAFVLTNITLAYDTIYCGMLSISTAALKSICREIRELDEIIPDHKTSEENFKNIIEKIIETSDFTNNISDIFSMTTMVHIVYTCGTMALGLYVISKVQFNDLNFISMLLATMMSILLLWIYCYFGQILVDERRKLQTELYFLKWYEASRNLKIMILVSMTVLQKDGFVFAGKIIPLSLETFGQVLMRAYTFFTFMNDFKQK